MNPHEKRLIALRYRLQGMGFYTALNAMQFAMEHHTGFRKDNVTPEFAHQVSIASYLLTLKLNSPEYCISVAFLHDVMEDYNVEYMEIERNFGVVITEAVWAMTKEFKGNKKNPTEVFMQIGNNEIASIVKLGDRINNQDSMVGVFSSTKMEEYITETEEFFLPMLKIARRLFPSQELAYENAKLVLQSQIRLVKKTKSLK